MTLNLQSQLVCHEITDLVGSCTPLPAMALPSDDLFYLHLIYLKNQPVKEADSDTNVLHFSNQVNPFTCRWWKRSNR
jgi:hypothetical protein